MAVHGRGPRPSGRASDGQHFLRSDSLARELIEQIGVSRADLVVEIGAGTGALTRPLLACSRGVVAIELDDACVAHLRATVGRNRRLRVVHANALRAPLPGQSGHHAACPIWCSAAFEVSWSESV